MTKHDRSHLIVLPSRGDRDQPWTRQTPRSVEVQETMKSMVSRAYTRRGPIVAQIVITLDPDRERHRDHNRIRYHQFVI